MEIRSSICGKNSVTMILRHKYCGFYLYKKVLPTIFCFGNRKLWICGKKSQSRQNEPFVTKFLKSWNVLKRKCSIELATKLFSLSNLKVSSMRSNGLILESFYLVRKNLTLNDQGRADISYSHFVKTETISKFGIGI